MTETLKYSVTESGADTYTESEKSLEQEIGNKRRGKKGSSTKVMLVKAITIEWPRHAGAAVDADAYQLQITTNSEAAMVHIDDKDCFFQRGINFQGIALTRNDQIVRYEVDRLYIKKDMYIGIDSNGHGAAATIYLEIDFDYVYVNDWKLSRMISRKA